MLPIEDWDNEPRPAIEGENLCYAKDFRKPCPTTAPPAPSPSTVKTPTSTSGASQSVKRVARKSADLAGLIADQFTHLAFLVWRKYPWTVIERYWFAFFQGIASRLDRLAIKLLLRSR